MADVDNAAGEGLKGHRAGIGGGRLGRQAIDRIAGHLREQVQNVHQDQFLMLLLMRQAEIDQGGDVGPLGQGPLQQGGHGGVHMAAIGPHLAERRAGDQAAGRPRAAGADSLVIGVEQEAEALVEHPVIGIEGLQQEGFEEPGGVGLMPFDRAGVRHGLDHLILGRQRRGQGQGARAHGVVARAERGRRAGLFGSEGGVRGAVGGAQAQPPGQGAAASHDGDI